MTGVLYIVSTPIGNLDDITLRALRVLRDADVIAAEDTRHSRKLLSHFNISNDLISYWSGKEKERSGKIIEILKSGRDVALISDAGTPGISDPGEVLIKEAIDCGLDVVPVPGPSALISAVTVSGLSTKCFVFAGFVPSKKQERARFFSDLSTETRTVIVYEAPHRLIESLDVLSAIMPARRIALCHELTKMNESVYRGNIEQVTEELKDAKIAGEYVLIIAGAEKGKLSNEEALNEVRRLMRSGKRRKEAVSTVAEDYGLSKKKLYDMSLE